MKKANWIVAVLTAVALAGGAVIAADLENLNGQSCGGFEGTWHFVNNQIPAASPAGSLNAYFSGGVVITVGPSAVNKNTQHFHVVASGDLLGASTNLGGRLVLSDFSCTDKGDPK